MKGKNLGKSYGKEKTFQDVAGHVSMQEEHKGRQSELLTTAIPAGILKSIANMQTHACWTRCKFLQGGYRTGKNAQVQRTMRSSGK